MGKVSRYYDFANGTVADAEKLDDELNNLVSGHNALDDELISHKGDYETHRTSADHDGRYYTKNQTDDQINDAITNGEQNRIIQTGTVFPTSPTEGQTFYKEDEEHLYVYNNLAWKSVQADGVLNGTTSDATYLSFMGV